MPIHPLRSGFTAYFVLSPENGSFASVAAQMASRNLAPAPRRPNHTTSPYASGAYVQCAFSVHRIPPRVGDVAQRPLSSGETGRADSADLPDGLSGIFLREGLDRLLVICPSGRLVASENAGSALRAKRSNPQFGLPGRRGLPLGT